MRKRSKSYQEKATLVDATKMYQIDDGISLVKALGRTKFDETIEVSFSLGIDVRHSEQQIRGTMIMPHGVGKQVKVAVIAKGEKAQDAEQAGATLVGAEDLVERIKGGFLDFDVLITTPDMMKSVGQLGKLLGRRGLMPTPKTGTVTMDIKAAVKEFKAGKLEYRADKYGIIHMPIGKISFTEAKLIDNYTALKEIIVKSKPSSAKGVYLKSIYLSPTMGPSVKLDTNI